MKDKRLIYLTENKLVNDFKKSFKSTLVASDSILLLEEIKTSWGVVDILAIKYDTKKLVRRRELIGRKEIRNFTNISGYALTHIIENPYLTFEELGNHLRIKNGLLNETVENLVNRGLIFCYGNGKLRACSVTKNYVIKEILAFEAKLKNWKIAVNQSERHLWFTNSSFVVLPKLTETVLTKVQKSCREKGIGLIIQVGKHNFQILKQPLYKKHIDSIISWKINEAIVSGNKFNGSNPLR